MQATIEADEDIKHSGHVSQTRLKMVSRAVKHVFGMTHHCEQGESGFNAHAIIPSAFEAQLQIFRRTRLTAKAQICQHQTIRQQVNQGKKILVTMIHGQPVPADNLPQTIEYPADFQTNRPTAFIAVLGADLLSRVPCPNGKQ